MRNYSQEIKEEAVRLHLDEGITTREVMERLGINTPRRIRAWCEAYRKEGLAGLRSSKPMGRPKKSNYTEQEHVECELRRLRMENELLRNFLYEAGRR